MPPSPVTAARRAVRVRALWSYPSWFTKVLVANACLHAAVYAVRPLAAYQALALGASPAGVGAVASSFALLSLFLALPAGRWVDRMGEPPFIVCGTALAVVGALAPSVATSVPALAATQALLGLGHLLAVVASQTLIANRTADAQRDERVGAYTVMASLGQLAGPALAGAVVGTSAARHLGPGFFLAGGLALLASLSALGLGARAALGFARATGPRAAGPEPPVDGRGTGPVVRRPAPSIAARSFAAVGASARRTARLLLRPGMPPAMFASLTVLSSIDVLSAYLPVLGEARGLSVATVGLLLSIRGGASLVSRLFMAWLLRRMTRARLLFWSTIVPAFAVAALPLAPSPVLGALMALAGLGLGLGQPLTMSWVASRAPADERGAALGLRLSGNRLGQLGIPAAVGLVGNAAGEASVFWAIGAALLLAASWVVRAPFGEAAGPAEAASTGG
ncbi:MAG: MFS transporter [Clostridia bacterium]|nr:MFS transporter [Clostridia bacterium]